MDQSLQHDAAVAMAKCLVNIIAPCLREEEQREAAREFYQVIRAGLEAYEEQRERDVPKPSAN
jgi:hypothetical protein